MLISFLYTDMSVTKFNDNPDFVEIAIFSQQRNAFCLPKGVSLFIQAAGLVYHHARNVRAYHRRTCAAHIITHQRVYHHKQSEIRTACVFSLRLDEIRRFASMIYKASP